MNNKKIWMAGLALMLVAGAGAGFSSMKANAAAGKTTAVATATVQTQDKADKADKPEANNEADGEKNDKQEAAQLAKAAKITETDAVNAALAQVPGKVKSVELEDEDGTAVYGVHVAGDKASYDVKVDAATGKVLKAEKDDDSENSQKNDQETNDDSK